MNDKQTFELPSVPLREARDKSFEACETIMDRQRWYREVGKKGWIFVDEENPFANTLYTKAMIATELLKASEEES